MSEFFLKIVNMSISASWLVLAVLILRLALKKAPKWTKVVLWGIVAVRLICPFSVESALSLIPSAETIPLNIEMDTTPAINSGISAINNVVNPVISQSNTPVEGASANPLQIAIGICESIWMVGAAGLLLYAVVSYWRLRRKVAAAVRYDQNIFRSENVSAPFVLGILKPRIYLPFKLEGQELEYVVAHERAHICRKDHWWKLLGFLLLTIHWFNPLMWLAYVLLCRDIELACDEKVIKELGNAQRADYTQALVTCSVNRRTIAACPLAFGEVGVKARVKSVMNYKKPAFWLIVLAVVACLVVAVCFLTNPVGFRFDEASNTVVSASYFDMRTADDPAAVEMNPAQIDELSSRLAGVKHTKRSDRYGGLTAAYQISARLQDGTDIRISGYSLSENDMVDIAWNGERYVVSDGDFQAYLSRICAGGDVFAGFAINQTYEVVEVTYESPFLSYYMIAQVNTPEYRVDENKHLISGREHSDTPDWTDLGELSTFAVTKENFDELFLSNSGEGWVNRQSASEIRRNTTKAWSVVYGQDRLHYILQQKNGELYLAYGYYDYSEKDDPGSDDTHIQRLYKLAPKTSSAPPGVTKWFDYTDNPAAMEDKLIIEIPEYQNVIFWCDGAEMIASKPYDASVSSDRTILLRGTPILNAYFTDLTGDGYPEICATYSYGSGIIDTRFVIYDYVHDVSYEMSDRGYHDFSLRLNEEDGYLYADKRVYPYGELVMSGRLVVEDDGIQIIVE